jgi:hypothetical protein
LEHVGGACAKHLVGHTGTEGGSKPLLFWPLHQNEQGHQQANKDEDHQQEVDDDGEPFNRS